MARPTLPFIVRVAIGSRFPFIFPKETEHGRQPTIRHLIGPTQSGVIALPGDYNNDGRADIAFHRPGSRWQSAPVLLANGDGSWTSVNFSVPYWANQPGVIALPGDYSGDGKTDIAFHRPGSRWLSVPILFAKGNGTWNFHNYGEEVTSQGLPDWSNQPGVIALPGDYSGDGKTDIAFHRPGSHWQSLPVLRSHGNGDWTPSNAAAPGGWANQPDVIAIPGDYDNDSKTDIALHRPGSHWQSLPVYFSQGDGTWTATNHAVPGWANQSETIAIPGNPSPVSNLIVPELTSDPGATNTLFLDFDGIFDAVGDFDLPAMDFDGDPSSFSDFEKELIIDIHKRVAEDYLPFDINVTTIDPSGKANLDPSRIWTTAIGGRASDLGLGGNDTGCYGCISGVPVVWSTVVGANSAQLANTASHESGHKFGLQHQSQFDEGGNLIEHYSLGGSDWTPIMGNNLQTDRTVWHYGLNVSGELQNDVAILGNRLGYRDDDPSAGYCDTNRK